ncbi:MAG TPA: hypothetical protein PKE27_04705 [Povalibacter sp.]|uniref:hypothetical protein n=1 Tax=Povalibacter sp. TaxID=1962978 RepID=UPI002C7E921F|nr:hypothetical protein [Povalibacter sp.]HMN43846.1 hypothetical protein [Povalibacter sp.]
MFVCAGLFLAACTTIKIDHGGVNEITHEGGAAEAQELADRACHRAGSGYGKVVSTVNKDASLPPGTGRQVTTFRCTNDRG